VPRDFECSVNGADGTIGTEDDCTCQPKAGLGEECYDGDSEGACNSTKPLCIPDLVCNNCICEVDRDNPLVTDISPAADETGVCRNSIIKAKFDQSMDIGSFANNVILLGDYESDSCPSDSYLLSLDDGKMIKRGKLAIIYNKLNKKIKGGNKMYKGLKSLLEKSRGKEVEK